MLYATTRSTGKNWVDVIPSVEMGLRCSQIKDIKLTPYEIVFGRKMSTPLNHSCWEKCRIPKVSDYVNDIRKILEEIHGKMRNIKKKETMLGKNKQFKIGEMVFVKIFPIRKGINLPRYGGPYKIIGIKGEWCYVLRNCKTGEVVERNHYHIKKYNGSLESQKGKRKRGRTHANTSIWSRTKTASAGSNNLDVHVGEGAGTSIERRRYPERNRRQATRYGFPLSEAVAEL